jgi:hypothetical protein
MAGQSQDCRYYRQRLIAALDFSLSRWNVLVEHSLSAGQARLVTSSVIELVSCLLYVGGVFRLLEQQTWLDAEKPFSALLRGCVLLSEQICFQVSDKNQTHFVCDDISSLSLRSFRGERRAWRRAYAVSCLYGMRFREDETLCDMFVGLSQRAFLLAFEQIEKLNIPIGEGNVHCCIVGCEVDGVMQVYLQSAGSHPSELTGLPGDVSFMIETVSDEKVTDQV